MGFEVLFKGKNLIRLLEGVGTALNISLVSVVISLFAGCVLGIIMTSKNPVIKFFSRIYLEFMRIMPQLVLLFIVYFGVARLFGINLTPEFSSILVFSLWGTAEMSDLVRGAVTSIPESQYESSAALGFTKSQTYLYVIIPQTLRRILPLSINLITRMIKTTSLVMMIGIVEVLKVGQQIIEANRKSSPNAAFGVFAMVFLLYFLICFLISSFAKFLEHRWEE